MSIYKICLLLIIIGLSACTSDVGIEEDSVKSQKSETEIISKPEKRIIVTPNEEKLDDVGKNTAHSHNGFVFDTNSPINITSSVETEQICSPLASVPWDELSSVVSDPYDPPPKGKDDRHQGTDFAYYHRYNRASIAGEIVQSVFTGRVAGIVEDKFPYGNAVIIETPYEMISTEIQQQLDMNKQQSIYTLYGHLSQIITQKIGSEIVACQPVGKVGKTGNTGVEHLHLEMRIGPVENIIPSMGFYVSEVTKAERKAYQLWRTSGVFLHFNPMDILDILP